MSSFTRKPDADVPAALGQRFNSSVGFPVKPD
jgi:hypothetical protein